MKANEWTSSLPFFTNNEATIKVKYNNQLLRRYDGRITNFVSLVETNPMSARNMFAAGDTGDFCSAIYLYHPYKQNKDKIEITLTSAMSCDETTVWLWDYFMDV